MERRLAAILAADVVGYSRLMGTDEAGTLTALTAHHKELIEPKVAQYNGRIVKLMGDGALMEFPSAVDALSFAVEVQCAMRERNRDFPKKRQIIYRIGINIGDIIIESEDIYGDGVNIAARLEGLADPGGICVARNVFSQVKGKVDINFQDMGAQSLKNISEPIHAYRIVPEDTFPKTDPSSTDAYSMEQEVHFCTTSDGVNIAYALVGNGPPLVKAPNWMSHLEYEWESPIWRHVLNELGKDHTLIRFDQRTCGLSDWDVEDISFDAFVSDLEVVVDTLGLERFPLLGFSQGCAISIAYSVRHPERVSHLILYGGFARGSHHRNQSEKEQTEAMVTLMRHGWGKDNPAFRQMFTSRFVPEGTHEQMEWFNELQRVSASAENAVRLREAVSYFEVTDLLPQVSVPTLILHCRGDAVIPFNEGRRMAATIPDAQFVSLEGNNHLILEHEPAWARFQEEVRDFLKDST